MYYIPKYILNYTSILLKYEFRILYEFSFAEVVCIVFGLCKSLIRLRLFSFYVKLNLEAPPPTLDDDG